MNPISGVPIRGSGPIDLNGVETNGRDAQPSQITARESFSGRTVTWVRDAGATALEGVLGAYGAERAMQSAAAFTRGMGESAPAVAEPTASRLCERASAYVPPQAVGPEMAAIQLALQGRRADMNQTQG